jgi:hypothetical protein
MCCSEQFGAVVEPDLAWLTAKGDAPVHSLLVCNSLSLRLIAVINGLT